MFYQIFMLSEVANCDSCESENTYTGACFDDSKHKHISENVSVSRYRL